MNNRSWKIVLAVSLALNVFLVGAIAGGVYQWFAARGPAAALVAQPRALRFAAQTLSTERQKDFADSLKRARREGRQFAREGRDERREVLRLLAAPQFDRAALDAALARTRAADSNLRAQVESNVADFAARLSSEERVKFADSLRLHGQWREPLSGANVARPANPASAGD
ncbi:periplasmic heavy metal sensor [Paraburkholderia dilworthii]|uniref:periplasmic heavy metal sensor n=1 Tax=Paraburkholderia dilworthii TaxID=948106 RepID=UPI0003F7F714|nr:periplasmic heavy metal sensor [Paraburkholderia dilworthii]